MTIHDAAHPAPQTEARLLAHEIERRRTFAIISHPDAGKTTITEKLLLYGGAIQEAGSVTAREGTAHTRSDWMSIEQQRGISISSSALTFEYAGRHINLLDTPGHQDFSEDTYRTLTAADSALMVLDAARGVQAQTEKLFAVCRNRGIPILTFVNKMDRPAQDIFDLLEQVEGILKITAVPLTWPIGDGPDFKGVYDLVSKQVLLFERVARGKSRAPVSVTSVDDPHLSELVGPGLHAKLQEDVALIEGAMPPFDQAAFLAGELTPVFFGSAMNNFPREALDRFGEIPRLQTQVPPIEERLGIGGGAVVGHRLWEARCRNRGSDWVRGNCSTHRRNRMAIRAELAFSAPRTENFGGPRITLGMRFARRPT